MNHLSDPTINAGADTREDSVRQASDTPFDACSLSAVNLGLLCGPLGIDPIGFSVTPAQAINLIRHPSYDFFQPVQAIEQGGEFEGVDPLHQLVPFVATAQGPI